MWALIRQRYFFAIGVIVPEVKDRSLFTSHVTRHTSHVNFDFL